MVTMRMIPCPAWADPFDRSVDHNEHHFGEENLRCVLAQRETILSVVHQAVQGYIDDSSLTFDLASEGFPAREKLTGDYYIGSESYWINDKPWFSRVGRSREYRFSFQVRCLEHLWYPNQNTQDYLGLEVHFHWVPDECRFQYHGDIDSSVI
jgi:hypothetical protein